MTVEWDVAVVASQAAGRLAAGEPAEQVARWLYHGPTDRQPGLVIKVLRSAGVGLAEGKRLVDGVMAEVVPGEFRKLVAFRQEAIVVMDHAADPGA